MKIEEVDTAKMAITSAMGRMKRGRGAAIRPFYRRSNLHARSSSVL
jgi:hypothetical protein